MGNTYESTKFRITVNTENETPLLRKVLLFTIKSLYAKEQMEANPFWLFTEENYSK